MGSNIIQLPWVPNFRGGKIAAEISSPGPACVQLPTLVGKKVPDSKKPGAPAFSFGQKHRRNYDSIGPGPAQYDVTGLGMKGKATPTAASLRSRPKDKIVFTTPAPGEYDVDRGAKAIIDATPKYSFGQKPPKEKPSLTPAPTAYEPEKHILEHAPSFTFGLKPKDDRLGLNAPAPGHYRPENYKLDNSPAFTFGLKVPPMPALPKGAYVEDRILQRRERRLASPVRTNQNQNKLNADDVNFKTTVTVTEVCANNVDHTPTSILTNPTRVMGEQGEQKMSKEIQKHNGSDIKANSTAISTIQHTTSGTLRNSLEAVKSSSDNASSKLITTTTTMRTVANGVQDNGREFRTAQGKSDAAASKSAGSVTKTVVQPDGTTVTTTTTSRTSAVKYAVEASATHEKISSS